MNGSDEHLFFFDLLDPERENDAQREKLRLKEGERREVAVLFADVKNSTMIGSRMDPEAFKRLIEPLMKRFSRCITHYGGYVDKFMGDGVMALFGARRATEQDTERAVLAGLKMIEQVEVFNRKLEAEHGTQTIGIRVGINTGLVVVGKFAEDREGDFTVIGSMVNLAQRMESAAPENRILMPANAMRAVERFFEFEPFGNVQAKGFAEPIDCYAVVAPREQRGPRWQHRKSVFIGREAEMTLLNRAFRELRQDGAAPAAGGCSVKIIGVMGDAGLGKTRLVHEFCQARAGQVTLLRASASGIVRSPLNLFVDLLQSYFHISPGDCVESRRAKLEDGFRTLAENVDAATAEELLSALPLAGALLEIPSQDARLRQSGSDLLAHLKLAMRCVLECVLEAGTAQNLPVVLVLDDIHWMDDASAEIFRYLVSRLLCDPEGSPRRRMMLILLYRQGYCPVIDPSHAGSFAQIELKPLTDSEITRLVGQHSEGISISEEVLAKVRKLSVGNPFYLEEWCNYLGDLGGHDLKDLPIPASLHALVLSRLDMLEGSIRLLLQKAAVIGQEFFVDILGWIEEKLYNPIDVNGTLSQLENQSFILKLLGFDYSAYFFKHITTRDVAYQTLLLENRAILHQLAAQAIEDLYPQRRGEFLHILADHYHRAGIADKAAFYLEQAARAAQKVFDNSNAIALWERLLGWMPSLPPDHSPGEARVLLALVELRSLTGRWDEADSDLQQAFAAAARSGNRDDLFDCHRLRGTLAFRHGNMETSLDEWTAALELAGDNTQLSVAHGNLGIWHQHHRRWEEAQTMHNLSLEEAEKAQDPLRAAKTLSNLGLMYQSQQDFARAEELYRNCLDLCEAHNYLQLKSIALGNLGYLRYKQGDADDAMRCYEQKWLLARKLDDQAELTKVLGNIANIHRDKGLHLEALDYYRQVLALKLRLGNKLELAKTHAAIALEQKELGDMDAALENILEAISYAGDYPNNLCEYLYYQADFVLELGRRDQAEELCSRAREIASQAGNKAVEKACALLDAKIHQGE